MEQYFVRLANVRHLPRTLALCVFLLALPTVGIGLQADDFVIAQQVHRDPFGAFAFMPGGEVTNQLRERGLISWSSSHELKLRLLRPLSSLSHALDFALWPEAPWLMHLENVLLYAALVWVAALIYAQLLGDQQAARLAAMFYALSPAHATSVGWISARNTILTALLGLLSVLLFLRAHDSCSAGRRRWVAVASVGAHALALLASEAAVAVLAPLLAYALILDTGSRRSRALRVSPHLLLCAGYLLVYARLGYGAAHSGMYLNALQQPWAVLENLLVAVPLYLHSSLVVPHAALMGLLPSGSWLLVTLTCLALLALGIWIVPVLRSHKLAQFFALSALASIPPLAATIPQDRLGFFVGLGCCGLLAVCLSADLKSLMSRGLFQLHTSAAVLTFVPACFVICVPALGGASSAMNAALADPVSRDAVFLNVPVETAVVSVDAMRQHHNATLPRSIRALYVGGAAYDVRRVDERTLDVHVARAWFRNAIERIVRDPRAEPFAPGDEETTDIFTARVLEVDTRGAPLRVRFQFVEPLDDPRWLWLRFEGARVVPWTPPRVDEAEHLGAAGVLL